MNVLYPESPISIPKNLTSLKTTYRFKAFLAILSIILFFVLYSALVVGLGFLVYHAFTYDMGVINKITILMKIGAILGSAMLFVFTLKFIFKLKNHKPKNRIKLKKDNYPELWDFVYKICKETGAPKPKSIYADPDVNAYVSYTNMWLSLFLPVKKELTIGLGLVSCLNLSEFKAVISHEFGHFAQRSMKIGSYIISANTIIHGMIFSRDKWDDLLDQWRGSDIRLSAAAWVITPIIWLIRQVLNLFYQFLNIMYSSLSREMEFNADKVAIKTSGSDSILSALWHLDHGYNNWNSTINHAYLACQKNMYVKNLYEHNHLARDRKANETNELLKNLTEDSRGGKKFFTESAHSKVNMYASHPPNDKRQNNAKEPYIYCNIDIRSPWLLFRNCQELQERMSVLVYNQYLNKEHLNFVSSSDFENFIQSENAGKELLLSYENTFENRYLNIPEKEVLKDKSQTIETSEVKYTELKSRLKDLMKPIKEIESLMAKANDIAQGTTKESSFSFNGTSYTKKNLQEGYSKLFSERENLFNDTFKEWDENYCAYHYAIAQQHNKDTSLLNLYEQHKQLSSFYKTAVGVKNTIINKLQDLQSREVSQNEVRTFSHQTCDSVYGLNKDLDKLEEIPFSKLPNIDNVKELREAIVEGGSFKKEIGNIFENGKFNILLNTLENAIVHCQRLDQKSVAEILGFHRDLRNMN